MIGKPAPDFSLRTNHLHTHSLKPFLGKKKLILIFFNHTSDEAKRLLQDVVRVYKTDISPKGVVVFAISDFGFWKMRSVVTAWFGKMSVVPHFLVDKKFEIGAAFGYKPTMPVYATGIDESGIVKFELEHPKSVQDLMRF
jgi:peroxiredoxin